MPPTYRLVGWGYAGLCATLVIASVSHRVPARAVPGPAPRTHPIVAPIDAETNASEWFRRVKPYCNSVEITTLQRGSPPPNSDEGVGFHAACFALAGRIDDARRLIDALSSSGKTQAANIVFDIGHPVADAGDDRSAGPIMELVVDYIPDHYMALYHAGMAEYMLGQREVARKNLTNFLRFYHEKDGWTSNATQVLGRINDPANAATDPRRPREP
ncbi:MAG: hypothetical protein ABJF01_11140 [bacterium]